MSNGLFDWFCGKGCEDSPYIQAAKSQPMNVFDPTVRAPDVRKCGTCKWFDSSFGHTFRPVCRRHPPTYVLRDGTTMVGCWPPVESLDYCGDWEDCA